MVCRIEYTAKAGENCIAGACGYLEIWIDRMGGDYHFFVEIHYNQPIEKWKRSVP